MYLYGLAPAPYHYASDQKLEREQYGNDARPAFLPMSLSNRIGESGDL